MCVLNILFPPYDKSDNPLGGSAVFLPSFDLHRCFNAFIGGLTAQIQLRELQVATPNIGFQRYLKILGKTQIRAFQIVLDVAADLVRATQV